MKLKLTPAQVDEIRTRQPDLIADWKAMYSVLLRAAASAYVDSPPGYETDLQCSQDAAEDLVGWEAVKGYVDERPGLPQNPYTV